MLGAAALFCDSCVEVSVKRGPCNVVGELGESFTADRGDSLVAATDVTSVVFALDNFFALFSDNSASRCSMKLIIAVRKVVFW